MSIAKQVQDMLYSMEFAVTSIDWPSRSLSAPDFKHRNQVRLDRHTREYVHAKLELRAERNEDHIRTVLKRKKDILAAKLVHKKLLAAKGGCDTGDDVGVKDFRRQEWLKRLMLAAFLNQAE